MAVEWWLAEEGRTLQETPAMKTIASVIVGGVIAFATAAGVNVVMVSEADAVVLCAKKKNLNKVKLRGASCKNSETAVILDPSSTPSPGPGETLEAVKAVDGAGSGLDADTVQGLTPEDLRAGQGPQGDRGPQGKQGVQGAQGVPGLNCWDVNGDHSCQLAEEDVDGDGSCTVMDCEGPPGPTGPPGSGGGVTRTVIERLIDPDAAGDIVDRFETVSDGTFTICCNRECTLEGNREIQESHSAVIGLGQIFDDPPVLMGYMGVRRAGGVARLLNDIGDEIGFTADGTGVTAFVKRVETCMLDDRVLTQTTSYSAFPTGQDPPRSGDRMVLKLVMVK
jgi:hypothetical protein